MERFGRQLRDVTGSRLMHGREPEVEEFRAAAAGQEDVRGFQIAMNDAVPMRVGQGVGDFDGDADQLARRQRAALQTLGERLSFQVLHHQVGLRRLEPGVVQRTDVGMAERRDGARFGGKARARLFPFVAAPRDDLQGDQPIEPRIARAIHIAHAAAADLLQHEIGTEVCRPTGAASLILAAARPRPSWRTKVQGIQQPVEVIRVQAEQACRLDQHAVGFGQWRRG